MTREQADRARRILAPGPDGARRYRAGFPGAGPDELHEAVNSDWLFRMPSLHLAQAHHDAGARAHLYELTWPAPGLGGILGACHGLDVPLVFGNLDRGQPAALIGDGPSPGAEALSAQMRAAWTRFAAAGDPGWPAYDSEHRLTQLYDAQPKVAPYPRRDLTPHLAAPHLRPADTAQLIFRQYSASGVLAGSYVTQALEVCLGNRGAWRPYR